MRRSELALLTLLVLAVALTVFTVVSISAARTQHSLGDVITQFEESR